MFSVSKKGGNKTKRHEVFHHRVAQLGCIVSGSPQVHIHHLTNFGAKAKRGGEYVGEWAVIPLHPLHHHQQFEHQARAIGWGNLHANKKDFTERYGTELDLFTKMIQQYALIYNDDILCHRSLELILEDY